MRLKFFIFFIFINVNLLNAQVNNKSIESVIDSIYTNSNIPSFALSVIHKDGVAFKVCKGYADKENSINLNDQHSILIASLSKTFIGVSLMKAIEDGHFTLETNINDILPFKVVNPYHPNSIITIRHLVTHTSGISDNLEDYRKVYFIENPLQTTTKFDQSTKKQIKKALKNQKTSLNEMLKEIFTPKGKFYKKTNFSKHSPGENYEYSNTASALASLIIEVKTGINYKEYVDQFILNPLKMTNSTFFPNELNSSNQAILYTGNNNQRLTQYYSLLYPIGGLYSSLEDMNKYLIEMIKGISGNGTLLTEASYKIMFSKQLKKLPTGMKDDEINQGVFWVFQDENTIGHTGGGFGASAFMFINTEKEIGKLFITNCELTSSQERVNSFINLWYLMDDIIKN